MMRSTVLAALCVCKRAEDQVAGRRRGDGQFDGFQVAHFTDEDDVRVFAQRAAQARRQTIWCAGRLRGG